MARQPSGPFECVYVSSGFLTVLLAVLLVGLGGFVGSGTGNQLMGEGSLVLGLDTAVLVVVVGGSLVGVVCGRDVSDVPYVRSGSDIPLNQPILNEAARMSGSKE